MLTTVNTPWQVKFDTARRSPVKPVIFKTLIDWSASNDAKLPNYMNGMVSYAMWWVLIQRDLHAQWQPYLFKRTKEIPDKIAGTLHGKNRGG